MPFSEIRVVRADVNLFERGRGSGCVLVIRTASGFQNKRSAVRIQAFAFFMKII